jgi:hypothetical protein
VVGLALGEVLQVDQVAARFSLGLGICGSLVVVIVVSTAGGGDEGETQDESKELEAPALSSHY